MISAEVMKSLQIITVDRVRYLGFMDTDDLKITHALEYDGRDLIQKWFKMLNVHKLSTVKLSANQGYVITELDEKQKHRIVHCHALMQRVKEHALNYYENKLFSDFLKN